MQKKRQVFLQMLLMELEDLQTDIHLTIDRYKHDYDENRISSQVFYQNVNLMQNEIMSAKHLYEQAMNTDPEQYFSVPQMALHLENWLENWCMTNGLSRCIQTRIKRKTGKVLTYFQRTVAVMA